MKNLSLIAFVLCLTAFGAVLALDALEFERTGECRECVALPIIRPDLREPQLIAGDSQ